MPARLRRKPCFDIDHAANSICSFFADQTSKNSKARIEHRSIEAAFRRNAATRSLEGPLRAARHAAQVERLEPDHVGRDHDAVGRLVQRIEARVGLALFGSGKPPHGRDSLRVTAIGAASARIFFSDRSEYSSMTANNATMPICEATITDQFAFARRGQDVNAAIDPNDLAARL